MTKRGIIEELLVRRSAFSHRAAETTINAMFDAMAQALERGERIEIRGFGSFGVKHREARQGRNPEDRRGGSGGSQAPPVFPRGERTANRGERCGGKPRPHDLKLPAGRGAAMGAVALRIFGWQASGSRQAASFVSPGLVQSERRRQLILYVDALALVMLNRYPYNNGHLMVAPRRHVASPELLTRDERLRLDDLMIRSITQIREALRPAG